MGAAEHEISREPGSGLRRPLPGLRRKPGRLALAVFRMPLRTYRHDAGWLLGHTFMEFVHIGRKTGRRYETVAMVLRYDTDAREAVICAGWAEDEAFDVAVQFRREHLQRMRLISAILGWGDLRHEAAVRGFIRTHPFVAFRPAASPA